MKTLLLAATLAIIPASALAQAADRQPANAITLLEGIARQQPENTSIRLLLARGYSEKGRYADAMRVLDEAQAIAPRDNDIALARARIALWSGKRRLATQIANEVEAREPGNAELAELRVNIARPPEQGSTRGPSINLSHTFSTVRFAKAGKAHWNETTLSGNVGLGNDTRITLDARREDRGAAVDTTFGARLDHQITNASLYIGGTLTPNADFREKWSLQAGGELRLVQEVSVTLNARHAEYGSTSINSLSPGIRVETTNGKNSLWLRSIQLWDDNGHQSGWSGRFDTNPSKRVTLFAGAARYPDTEAGITRQVKAIYAGGSYRLDERLTLRLAIDREQREQSYKRTGLNLGLGLRF